jgi:hypothetical protein
MQSSVVQCNAVQNTAQQNTKYPIISGTRRQKRKQRGVGRSGLFLIKLIKFNFKL